MPGQSNYKRLNETIKAHTYNAYNINGATSKESYLPAYRM